MEKAVNIPMKHCAILSIYFLIMNVMPERLLIVACEKSKFGERIMCTVALTVVSYKAPCCKCWSEHICACFQTRLSGEALTSMPHLLRVGNFYLRSFTLTVHSCNRNQPTTWALYWNVKLSMNRAREWLFQYSANIGVFLVA